MDTFPTAKPEDQHPTSENKLDGIISDEILRSRIRKISSEPDEPAFERLSKNPLVGVVNLALKS
jgi:hypothetical protein